MIYLPIDCQKVIVEFNALEKTFTGSYNFSSLAFSEEQRF